MKHKIWPALLGMAVTGGIGCAALGRRALAPVPPLQAKSAPEQASSPGTLLETAAQAAPAKAAKPSAGAADNLGVSGQAVTIFQPDPKLPGKFLFKIYARGITGQSVSSSFSGALTGVSAVLFQKGQASATLSAPTARADSGQQQVTASGRVHVKSLREPGTILDADTVVWHAKTNIIDATGNVLYRNGKNGVTLRGPRFRANTALQTISSAGPGSGSFR